MTSASIRVHTPDGPDEGQFVSVHETRGQAERELVNLRREFGGTLTSPTRLVLFDRIYQVWCV